MAEAAHPNANRRFGTPFKKKSEYATVRNLRDAIEGWKDDQPVVVKREVNYSVSNCSEWHVGFGWVALITISFLIIGVEIGCSYNQQITDYLARIL